MDGFPRMDPTGFRTQCRMLLAREKIYGEPFITLSLLHQCFPYVDLLLEVNTTVPLGQALSTTWILSFLLKYTSQRFLALWTDVHSGTMVHDTS